MPILPPHHRKAQPEDARYLAPLIDLAGEGVPAYLWAQMAEGDATPLDVGEMRAAREEGGFSYKNATVREDADTVAAMLLGYLLPDPYDVGDFSGVPDFLRPAIELEALAPGSWYINAVAVFPEFEGKGFGSALLKLAETLAKQENARELSLIVTGKNARAKGLYEYLGYHERARRPALPVKGLDDHGDWILMVKNL